MWRFLMFPLQNIQNDSISVLHVDVLCPYIIPDASNKLQTQRNQRVRKEVGKRD